MMKGFEVRESLLSNVWSPCLFASFRLSLSLSPCISSLSSLSLFEFRASTVEFADLLDLHVHLCIARSTSFPVSLCLTHSAEL